MREILLCTLLYINPSTPGIFPTMANRLLSNNPKLHLKITLFVPFFTLCVLWFCWPFSCRCSRWRSSHENVREADVFDLSVNGSEGQVFLILRRQTGLSSVSFDQSIPSYLFRNRFVRLFPTVLVDYQNHPVSESMG